MTIIHSSFRKKVENTMAFQSLSVFQQRFVGQMQNIIAIGKSLEFIKENGYKKWEEVTCNSEINQEIIRELHIQEFVQKL